MPDDVWDRILGPDGLAVVAVLAAVVLFREWRASMNTRIADLTKERDVALEGWRAQTAATNRVADTLEEDRRDRTARRRISDGESR
jgi:hypothetical protein